MSQHLVKTLKEVEQTTGRRISLVNGESRHSGRFIQGYHELNGSTDTIWLYPHLPPDASEATAAHELAHVIQASSGYPRALASAAPEEANYERLAAAINNLVLDVNADRWALKHGFNIGRALSCSGLHTVMTAMREAPVEACSEKSSSTTTLAMVLDYAALKLRLNRFGLFDELDRLWELRWPLSRSAGQALSRALTRFAFSSAASCRRAMEKIVEFLKVPPGYIKIS